MFEQKGGIVVGAFEQEGAGKRNNKGRGSWVGGGKGFLTGLSRIYVGACCTRSARSRRSRGWWRGRGRQGGGEGGGGDELKPRHG